MNALTVLIPLYIVLISFCYRVSKAKVYSKSIFLYLSILVFTVVVGLRYMVGNDYLSYLSYLTYGYGVDRLEPFSKFTIEYVLAHRIWPYYWFVLCAAIQITFFLFGFRNMKKILPYGVFFFLFYFLSFYTSGIRQANAISCIFFAFSFIKERKLIPYLLFVLFAFLNHRSAVLALPAYWIFNTDKILGIKMQIVTILAGLIVGQTLIVYLVEKYGVYLTVIGYDYLAERIKENDMKVEVDSGLGVIFNYIVFLVVVLYSKKLHEYFKDKNFSIYYNLFVFSVFCYGFTMHDQYLSRMMFFFRMSIPVVLAYATYYFVSKREDSIIWYPILAAFLVLEVYKWANDQWFFVF